MRRSRVYRQFTLLVVLVFLPALSAAQPSPDTALAAGLAAQTRDSVLAVPAATVSGSDKVELVGQIGGRTTDVAVEGDLAYIVEGAHVKVLDVTDVSAPQVIGEAGPFPSLVDSIIVSDGYAYIEARNSIYIFDISEPTKPISVSSLHVGPLVNADVLFAVVGGYAYVMGQNGSLSIVNVSDPSSPFEVGSVELIGGLYALDIQGGYGYGTVIRFGKGKLVTIDISTPDFPTVLSYYDLPSQSHSISVAGDLAYVGALWEGLRIIDVADPASPTELGHYVLPNLAWAGEVVVADDLAYVTAGNDGTYIIDVTESTNPTELSKIGSVGEHIGADISGGLAFLATGSGGLRIVDTVDPINPAEIGHYNTLSGSVDVDVSGTKAYLANRYHGLSIVNIASPDAPTLSGSYESGSARGVVVSSNYAFIAGYSLAGYSLSIVSVVDPANPVEVGTEALGNQHNLSVDGNYLYLAGSGLEIFDIANPEAPRLMGKDYSLGPTNDVAVAGDHAYVTVGYDGLRIIDISDPSNPFEVGFLETVDYAEELFVEESIAYVPIRNTGLEIVDVSDPTTPTAVGFFPAASAYEVTVSGDYAYLAAGFGGLRVIGIADPANPVEVGYYNTMGYAQDVDVSEGLVYVATDEGVLQILRFTGGEQISAVSPVHIEVTQAIQDEANEIPLVAGKPTFARVYIDCGEGCDKLENVTGTLQVSGPAGEQTLEPVNGPITAFHPAHWRDQRNDLRKTLNFTVPKNLMAGEVTFTATVGGQTYTLPLLLFEQALPVDLLIVPIRLSSGNAVPSIPPDTIELAKQVWPTSTVTHTTLPMQTWWGDLKCYGLFTLGDDYFAYNERVTACRQQGLLRWLTSKRQDAGKAEFVFGWLPAANGWGGMADAKFGESYDYVDGVNIAAFGTYNEPGHQFENTGGRIDYIEPQQMLAHEIGHLLQLRHTNEVANTDDRNCLEYTPYHIDPLKPWSPFHPKLDDLGTDVVFASQPINWTKAIRMPTTNYDYMSYCGSSYSLNNVWTSKYTYEEAFKFLQVPQIGNNKTVGITNALQEVDEALLLVSGMISMEDLAFLYPVDRYSNDLQPIVPVGTEYCVTSRDGNNNALASECFDVSFGVNENGSESVVASFSVLLPDSGSIASIELAHNGQQLASIVVSEHSPEVTVLSPNGGEIWSGGDSQTISWSANDVDLDELLFNVEYSTDGLEWTPLAFEVTDSELSVNVSELAGSQNAVVRVDVTDGFNWSSDMSDAGFSVERKAPQVSILKPRAGGALPGTPILLNAYAHDLEDGDLADAIGWYSNLDGDLGTGNDLLVVLSPGNHVLTVSVQDSDGNTGSAEHSIFVGVASKQIILDSGWNLISSNVIPTEASMVTIFPPEIRDRLVLCKTNDGLVYWPGQAIDQIEYWDPSQGYQCYASEEIAISIVGAPITWAESIPLAEGWNMVAYWKDTPITAEEALGSLGSSLVLAKTGDGKIYWPEFGINSIGDMQPGEGYKLNLDYPVTLIYPAD